MATAIFVNLPVSDVQRSSSFFTALGYTINPQFSDDSTACVVFSDTIYAMLLAEARFKDFTPKVVADARTATEAIICLGAASRADVDRIADAALANGGGRVLDPQDHGFMYGRSFADPDGHIWEVMWMDPAVASGGKAPDQA
jgi:predicted lactoylglutathione lyase